MDFLSARRPFRRANTLRKSHRAGPILQWVEIHEAPGVLNELRIDLWPVPEQVANALSADLPLPRMRLRDTSGAILKAIEVVAGVLLFLFTYLPSVGLGLRVRGLSKWFRWLFALTVLPIFSVSMILNIWITDQVVPIKWAMSAVKPLGGDAEALVAFLVSTPLAILIGVLWFKLLRRASRWPTK